jgi:stringent starvation protein B
MSTSNYKHLVRKAMVTATIIALEENSEASLIHAVVLAVDLSDQNAAPLLDVPMDKVNKDGTITLSIGMNATGYREFGEAEIMMNIRFNGVERQLFIPYSLIVGVVAISISGEALNFEQFAPFQPYVGDVVSKPEVKAVAAGPQRGNVVSLFATKH